MSDDPNLALLVTVLGALGIYGEFCAPGLVVPGVVGGIMVLLGLNALWAMPFHWGGAGLMAAGLALLVAAAFVRMRWTAGLGGAVLLAVGAALLVDGIRPVVAAGLMIPFAVLTVFLLSMAVRARENKLVVGPEGMPGEIGVAYTPLNLRGKVFVHGEYWDAESTRPTGQGDVVRVLTIEGKRLTVEPR